MYTPQNVHVILGVCTPQDLYEPVGKALHRDITFNELPIDWKVPGRSCISFLQQQQRQQQQQQQHCYSSLSVSYNSNVFCLSSHLSLSTSVLSLLRVYPLLLFCLFFPASVSCCCCLFAP